MKYILLAASSLFTLPAMAQLKAAPSPMPVYNYVEQMPSPGFDIPQFLSEHIHYPDSAEAHNIGGRVIVKFVVNEDGRLSDMVPVTHLGWGLEEEAIRVIKKMPPWKPGKQNGKGVKVYFTQPIMFKP